MKYSVRLVGYPRADICDPSNLTVNELYALRESLQKGNCFFEHLSDAERDALKAVADEQEQSGKNPYGKRKRRCDAGKSKKRRRTSTSEVHLGTTDADPPSDDSDDNDLSDGSISHEPGLPRRTIYKRPLKAARPVQRADLPAPSRSSTSAHASSTHPASITPSVDRIATPTEER